MNWEKYDGPEVEWRIVAYPGVEFDHVISDIGYPISAFPKASFYSTVQHFPQRRHAYHAGHVAVFDSSRQFFAGKFVKVSDLRAGTQSSKKTRPKNESEMQPHNTQNAGGYVNI
jgi:hypothetical protein